MKRPDQPLLTGLLSHIEELVPTHSESPSPILDPALAERAYLARQLVLCTLPHSNPGPIDSWVRRSGSVALVMTRTQIDNKGKLIGYPYGSLPRLILYWLNTECVRTKKRRIELGHTLSDFMREIGLNPANGTGPRGDATRLKDQMNRLFATSITFQSTGLHSHKWLNMQIASEGELWWEPHKPNQGQLWGSWVLIGERFFEAITRAPVPIDLRILREIRSSPLALDLYAWLTYSAFQASTHDLSLYVSWADLALQIGAGYSSHWEFARKSRDAFQRILKLYTGADIQIVSGGVRVKRTSMPSVQAAQLNSNVNP